MRAITWGALLTCGLWGGSASAVNTDGYNIPYAAVQGTYVLNDRNRPAENGFGYQLTFGVPLSWPNWAFELSFFDNNLERSLDGNNDYQTGLLLDGVYAFGDFAWDGRISDDMQLPPVRVQPFVVAGLAGIQEDVLGDKHFHFGIDAGGGLLLPLPFSGWNHWAVRTEARALGQLNNDSSPGDDILADFRFTVGLQIPLTAFFDRQVPVGPAPAPCDVQVVDPVTGRTDCAVDSDHDGIRDPNDRCPGTAPGTVVDRFGCAVQLSRPDDSDGDGVRDSDDQCKDTQFGFKVDDRGCVVAQDAVLPAVGFAEGSANLTGEAKTTLDGVARTLVAQSNLSVEIGGHTDSLGQAQYNLALSQKRAEAVRDYLISKGVEASRLMPAGYGEEKPMVSNETDDGRATNRRVEFKIGVS